LITARYFSSCPSDSISRWTPCPPPVMLSCGQRGITPAFGYSSPHLTARGTSTLLNNALLSAHYGSVRLPIFVHHRLLSLDFPMRPKPLPSGEHGISRFPRITCPSVPGSSTSRAPVHLALAVSRILPSAHSHSVGIPMFIISRLNSPARTFPCPTLQPVPRETRRMTRGQCGSLLLHCVTLSFTTLCRSPGAFGY
jgi:hypothetical protein